MSNPKFGQLSVLVADDFSSFRATLIGMLNRLGIKKIEEATRAQEVIKWCKEREFDLILCDYNLGSGRNGQHILEELRHRNLIQRHNLFIMVTAEASKEMVLSAYDCEPDDYLMKPLNLKVLEQRLGRLVLQRDTLITVYRLLEKQEYKVAIAELESIILEPGRHSIVAQKLLGQLYLESGRLDEADKLYLTNMEKRNLDWAQLGVAKVALARGELATAEGHLETLIRTSRLFLPAHDSLAEVYEKQRNFDALLGCMQEVVDLSPRSLLRQRKLAHVAMDHGEIKQALSASLEAMKLGEASCHKSAKDALVFLAAAGNSLELGLESEHLDLLEETKKCFAKLSADINLNNAEQIQATLMAARVYALSGDDSKAKQLARDGLGQIGNHDRENLDVGLAEYSYLVSVGDLLAANQLADQIITELGDQHQNSDKIDKLLPDPKNERNRQRVAQLNKAGIEDYNAGKHEEALIYFRRATLLFPRHVGLQLNFLQTMIAQLKQDLSNTALRRKVQTQINTLKLLINHDAHPQHARFQQLVESVEALPQK